MADNFFGFEADLPPDGDSLYSDTFKEAKDGDEIDLMNDETFGDINAGGDWEHDTHERMAEQLEGSFLEDRQHSITRDSGFSTAEKKFKTRGEQLEQSLSQLVVDDDDDDDIDDPAVMTVSKGQPIPGRVQKQNLDDLFGPSSPPPLLDADILVSPGKTNIWSSPTRDSLMQKAHQEEGLKNLLSQLQNPRSQMPPFQVLRQQGQDPSIVSAGKPMSSSLPLAKTVDEIEREMGASRNRAMTVEELERHIRGQAVPQGVPQGVPRTPSPSMPGYPLPIGTPPSGGRMHQVPQMSQRITPDRQSSPAQVVPQLPPMPPLTGSPMGPPPGHMPHPDRPGFYQDRFFSPRGLRVSPNQALFAQRSLSPSPTFTSQLLAQQTVPARMTPSPPLPTQLLAQQSLAARIAPYLQAKLLSPAAVSAAGRGLLHGIMGQRMPPNQMMYNTPRGMSRDHMMSPGPMNTPRQQRMPMRMPYTDPTYNRRPMHPGQMRPPGQNFYPGRGGPGPPPPHLRQHLFNESMDGRDFRNNGYNHRDNRDYGDNRRDNREYQDNRQDRHDYRESRDYQRRPQYYQQRHYHPRDSNADEYANLMTQREKDWIIKIQLLQLQTENPYLDDFYYTTYMMKQMARKRKESVGDDQFGNDDEPKLLLPQMAQIETKSYRPAQFEGSLGKLTASSVHNPRQIIDIVARKTGAVDDPNKESRRFRQLLTDIENTYNILLEVDDIEKKLLALPEEARKPLFEERTHKIQVLFDRLYIDNQNDEQFINHMAIRKGKKLVGRIIPLLDKVHAQMVVHAIVRHLVVILKKDGQENCLPNLYKPVLRVVGRTSLDVLVQLAEELKGGEPGAALSHALASKFGASLLWCLVQRGAVISRTESPVDLETKDQEAWSKFVFLVAETVASLPDKSLAKPLATYQGVLPHLESLLDNRTFVSIEDRLQKLLLAPEVS